MSILTVQPLSHRPGEEGSVEGVGHREADVHRSRLLKRVDDDEGHAAFHHRDERIDILRVWHAEPPPQTLRAARP